MNKEDIIDEILNLWFYVFKLSHILSEIIEKNNFKYDKNLAESNAHKSISKKFSNLPLRHNYTDYEN